MHRKMKTLAAVLLSFIVLPNVGQTRAAPTTPPPASQPAAPAEELEDKVLPSLDLDGVSLTDFLDVVHSIVPSFQYVIVRDPGVPGGYPTLPSMKLQKVTVGQVLSIIQEAFPGMEFHPVDSNHGPVLYLFKIHNGLNGILGQTPESVLKVYRLTEAVEMLVSRNPPPLPVEMRNGDTPAPARKKAEDAYDGAMKAARASAMNSVLSLIKAALAQAGDSGINPVVQVHEETQTLILRGSADQASAVQKALETLIPGDELAPIKEQLAKTQRQYEADLAKATDESARRTAELQEARAEADTLHKTVLDLEVAQERLKVQLEALQKKPATKE